MRRKSGIVTAAVLRVDHEADVQNLGFQLGECLAELGVGHGRFKDFRVVGFGVQQVCEDKVLEFRVGQPVVCPEIDVLEPGLGVVAAVVPVIVKQANRIVQDTKMTEEDLVTFVREDMIEETTAAQLTKNS